MPAQKVLIVEDDAHIRRLLRVALERAGYGVSEAGTAREGLSLVDIAKPDAVLLDLGLPDRDGLELIQLIKTRSQATVIVVSARDDTSEKVAALDLGADDYVSKPFDTEELLARLRTAFRHRLSTQAERVLVRAGNVEIDLDHRRVRRGDDTVHLTPKEYDVLAELAKRPDRVIGHTQFDQPIAFGGRRKVVALGINLRHRQTVVAQLFDAHAREIGAQQFRQVRHKPFGDGLDFQRQRALGNFAVVEDLCDFKIGDRTGGDAVRPRIEQRDP